MERGHIPLSLVWKVADTVILGAGKLPPELICGMKCKLHNILRIVT